MPASFRRRPTLNSPSHKIDEEDEDANRWGQCVFSDSAFLYRTSDRDDQQREGIFLCSHQSSGKWYFWISIPSLGAGN